ncbi:MAG: tryptophan ABC transporter substrate-binding protein [Coriobacteriia bacterium]|nr:tryptophan ABC transporter substrate-binding protein [Coriobacteriia bacterium]
METLKKQPIFIVGLILVILLAVFYFIMPSLVQNQENQKRVEKADSSKQEALAAFDDNNKKATPDNPYKIGLLQFVSHPSLDDIRQGIYDGLESRGYTDGEEIIIEFLNGEGEQSNLNMMSTQLINDGSDMLVGIATPAAQSLQNATQGELPLIMSAVTDPVGAGLVESVEKPNTNVTGTSDALPVSKQIDFIRQILPELKTLGIIYSSSEPSVVQAIKDVESYAEELGIEVRKASISSTNDMAQVAAQLASEVDAIWVGNDNMIASAIETLISATDQYKVPVFPSVDAMVSAGGVGTLGVNQYNIGLDTAAIIADVIEGKDPADYPIVFSVKSDYYINKAKAQELGIDIPQEILDSATDPVAQN